MNRQKLFLAITMMSRIGTGVVMLLFLARGLGPEGYGFVVTVLAYAQLIALLTDFGFSIQAVRDIGAEPHRAGTIISACLRVKNILVAGASFFALAMLLSVQLPADLAVSCILLYMSTIVLSYGDLALIVFRGIGKYDYETAIVVAGTIFFALVVGGTSLLFGEIPYISAALLTARTAQTIAALICVSRSVELGNVFVAPVLEVWGFAKSSSGLAVDTVLTVLSSQLDIIFVSALLGLESAGLYQIVSRVAGYLLLPAQVLAGVYLPLLSGHYKTGLSSRIIERRMQFEFLGLGLLLGLGLGLSMPMLTEILFGQDYDIPDSLWWCFGAFVVARSISASFGVGLIARRAVAYRIFGQAVGVSLVAFGLAFFLPTFGLASAPVVLVVSTCATILVYVGASMRLPKEQ